MFFLFVSYHWDCKSQSVNVDLPAGRHQIIIQGASGGRACYADKPAGYGGNGTWIQGKIDVKGGMTVTFNVGESKGASCNSRSTGGWPDGGDAGDDTEWFKTPDDYSGSGGGSTEVKVANTAITIMLAGGGSGGCGKHKGGPAGGIGYHLGWSDDTVLDRIEESGSLRKGGQGVDSTYTPGAGGGGGWRGGRGGDWADTSHWKACGYGGSSYINYAMVTDAGLNDGTGTEYTGDGCFSVETVFNCISNCYSCSSGSTCDQCNSGTKMYNRICYERCSQTPNATYDTGRGTCERCDSSCKTCNGAGNTRCTSCPNGKIVWQGRCVLPRTSEPTPHITPLSTPFSTPITTPIPTPYETASKTMMHTPVETPDNTPFITPISTPLTTPLSTPFSTPITTPIPTPYETASKTMMYTPVETPGKTPFVTSEMTPVETPQPTKINKFVTNGLFRIAKRR